MENYAAIFVVLFMVLVIWIANILRVSKSRKEEAAKSNTLLKIKKLSTGCLVRRNDALEDIIRSQKQIIAKQIREFDICKKQLEEAQNVYLGLDKEFYNFKTKLIGVLAQKSVIANKNKELYTTTIIENIIREMNLKKEV